MKLSEHARTLKPDAGPTAGNAAAEPPPKGRRNAAATARRWVRPRSRHALNTSRAAALPSLSHTTPRRRLGNA